MKSFDIFLFMKTGTKINKTRGRKGSLLILVMVIMAVALILITSAMTITVAARSHYNKTAVADQTQLTAMSGAKMIGDAVTNGAITVTQLENMAAANTVYALSSSGTVSPGLANSSTSKTTATFKKETISGSDYITVKVTTHIENTAVVDSGTDESATLFLKLTPVVIPDGFSATLSINGDGQLPSVKIGYDKASDYGSNFVAIKGSSTSNNGKSIYGGDMIITGKYSTNGNEQQVSGNLVLYGGAASINGACNLPQLASTSYFLDLCQSTFTGSTFWNTLTQSPSQPFTPKGIVLQNASMKFDSNNNPIRYVIPQNKIVYTVGSGQVKLDGTSITTAVNGWNSSEIYYTVKPKPNDGSTAVFDSLITKYTDPNGPVQKSLTFNTPQTREALMTMLGMDTSYATLTPTASIISKLTQLGAATIPLTTATYKGTAYIIDVSSSPTLNNPITFDLSDNNITLYIVGTGALGFKSNDGGLRFIRPAGSGNIGRIIFMQDGASFDISPSAGTLINFPGITGAGNDYNRYSKGDKDGVAITDLSEPYVYVYGFNNLIKYNSNKYMEGYYGLFGPTGKIYIEAWNKNKDPLFYARFNVTKFDCGGGNGLEIPYCPAPGEGSNNTANQTKYKVSGYVIN